jgi:WD40 repeat protein/DNA-binding SARP family transcriptional activator
MRVGVLGPVRVDGGATRLSPRDRVVLAALVARDGGPTSADALTAALWGSAPPASSRKVLQGCVARLRKALGHEAIATLPEGYQLTVPADEVDARRFDRLVRRADELLALGEPERAAHTAGAALALWRGTAFADLDGWDAGRIERERLEELRRDAEELQLDAQLRAGRHGEVLGTAQRLVDATPLRERRWALLARALYQAGRQSDALQTLHRARVLLSTELGLDPGPELTGLQDQILRHDPALGALPPPVAESLTCPYQGLVPYDVADAEGFFGRTDDIDACLRKLAAVGVVAVVGPSGAGKSSLVRAGVAARLRHDRDDVVIITPGAHPMDALTAVPSTDPPPVLIVDQCEEVVALCDDAAQRASFLQTIADHADRAHLVVALRADRLGELSGHSAFARLVERGLYLLHPMGFDDLRAVVERPAERAGLLVEPGLVDLLVHEVEGEAGALPLLSHALRTTWERREGRTLTVAGYADAGGIRHAVAQTADAVYGRVPEHQRGVLRDLLLRMVSRTDDGAPVRARLSRQLVVDDEEHAELVELLVAERLVTSDGDSVELAHEALIRAWPRLRGWLDEDALGQRILRHLSTAAGAWEQMGRPDSELYRGVRLAQAIEWRERGDPHLAPAEQAFLDASATLAEAERREVEERAARQERSNRRLRILLAGVGVLSVVALVAGVLAARQARRAGAAAVAADARRVGAQALVVDDIDTALLLAVAGVRLDDSPDTRANLLATLGRSPHLIEVVRGEGDGAYVDLEVSPDGRTIAVVDDANRLQILDASTHEVRATLQGDVPGPETVTTTVAFHPTGGPIAASFSAGTVPRPVVLLDPETFELQRRQLGGFLAGEPIPRDTAYSPDGDLLAVSFDQYNGGGAVQASQVVVWSIAAPEEPVHVLDVPRYTHGLAFSPDGRLLYTGVRTGPASPDVDPQITVIDLESSTVARTFAVPSHPLALSPDGGTIAAGADDGERGYEIVLVDAAKGRVNERIRGHREPVLDLAFAPDGGQLASSSADRSVLLWDTDGTARLQFVGHAGGVSGVAFEPDGQAVVSAGSDRLLLRWDSSGARQFTPVRATGPPARTSPPHSDFDSTALIAPDGSEVVYLHGRANLSGTLQTHMQVLDVDTAQMSDPIDTMHGRLAAMSWHPDGRHVVTSGVDGHIRVWDPRSGHMIDEGRSFVPGLGVAHLDNGDEIAIIGGGGMIERLDAASLEQVAAPFALPELRGSGSAPDGGWTAGGGHRFNFQASSWYGSGDGRTAAMLNTVNSRDDDGVVANAPTVNTDDLLLIDLVDQRLRGQVSLGFDGLPAEFSPDGGRIAVGGRRGQLAVVDVEQVALVRRPTRGHDGAVVSVSYAPDGGTIATGGEDGRVSIWDGRTGALLSSVTVVRPGTAAYVGFKPDGHTVSVATWDGEVYELDTRVERWIAFACDVAGRNLTRAEWRETFGDRPYRRTCPR